MKMTKAQQAQELNAQVEAFLAKGGKIKTLANAELKAKEKRCKKVVQSNKQKLYYDHKYNRKIREYCKTGESLARLSHKTLCTISLLEKYIAGEIELKESVWNSDFAPVFEDLALEKAIRRDIREHQKN